MKARSFIVRALLFALLLAPTAMRLSARPLGALSCRVAKPQLRVSHGGGQTGWAMDQFLASRQHPHAPAARLHRIRGKKISAQTGLVLTPGRCAPTHILISDSCIDQQDMDGPNPSRGPPSQLSC